ncbi:GNAT family N-acetyltransferase [Clostridioides sp. ES-S-0049-02]|nr:GNAT family N-acetyltransferase [Clostridioides sp. ES-S-0048-02]MCC0702218.1 GNAT family N-acetyltransferase [Clostridioides sp. ES-S-0049-02]
MILKTERLTLIPLSLRQLELWTSNNSELEKELEFIYCAEPMTGFFYDIVKGQLNIAKKDEKNILFYTFWFIMLNENRTIIGLADFKDVPNSYGEIEIGYGLGEDYKKQGYMTEAIKKICSWGLSQPNVSSVIAETDAYNTDSQNVLLRCGFKLYRNSDTKWWKLTT